MILLDIDLCQTVLHGCEPELRVVFQMLYYHKECDLSIGKRSPKEILFFSRCINRGVHIKRVKHGVFHFFIHDAGHRFFVERELRAVSFPQFLFIVAPIGLKVKNIKRTVFFEHAVHCALQDHRLRGVFPAERFIRKSCGNGNDEPLLFINAVGI